MGSRARRWRLTSLPAPEAFVVAADLVGVLGRDGLAVDGDERFRRLAAHQFLGDLVAELGEGLADGFLDDVPVGGLGVSVELGADGAGAVADSGGLRAEAGVADHFLYVAEAVGPVAEVLAGEGAAAAVVC